MKGSQALLRTSCCVLLQWRHEHHCHVYVPPLVFAASLRSPTTNPRTNQVTSLVLGLFRDSSFHSSNTMDR